jgi:hypothetical protein
MSSKPTGGSAKARRDQYKSTKRMETNRKIKLQRQMKLQPNNKNLEPALAAVMYRRKTPKVQVWSHTAIKTAKLFKLFGGRFDPKMLQADPKISQAALSMQSPRASTPIEWNLNKYQSNFFSIGARVGWA